MRYQVLRVGNQVLHPNNQDSYERKQVLHPKYQDSYGGNQDSHPKYQDLHGNAIKKAVSKLETAFFFDKIGRGDRHRCYLRMNAGSEKQLRRMLSFTYFVSFLCTFSGSGSVYCLVPMVKLHSPPG